MIKIAEGLKKRSQDRQMLNLYNSNDDFRAYVDRCCGADKRPIEDVLSLALVREAGKYYQEAEAEKAGRSPVAKSAYMPMGECV